MRRYILVDGSASRSLFGCFYIRTGEVSEILDPWDG
jgi:hypothetical protein